MFGTAVAKIVAAEPRHLMTHDRSRVTYQGVALREPAGDKMLIGRYRRLRMGHSIDLRGYAKRIGLADDGRCRWCEEEVDTVFA